MHFLETLRSPIGSSIAIIIAALFMAGFIFTFNRPQSPSQGGAPSGLQTVAPTMFADVIKSSDVHLIDVRKPEEFAAGHIAGAANINFYARDFQTKMATLNRNATYAIYCRTGHRSGTTLQLMQQLGFTHVYNLDGGITAWQAASLPVTTQ